jgi:hypothetical protein
MKLIDLIKNLDKSKTDTWTSLDAIASEFDIHDVYGLDTVDSRIKFYFMKKWYCTDTWVGARAYFMDGEFICVSMQVGRKRDEEFEWVSKEAFDKAHEYIKSLREDEITFSPSIISQEEFLTDVGEGYKLDFSGQLLTDNVVYDKTGELVKATNFFHNDIISKKLEIQFPDGHLKVVNMSEVTIPYPIIK